MNTAIEEQLADLRTREKFARAAITPGRNGAWVVSLPQFPLPPGWDRKAVNVYFVLPPGYPGARPRDFWTDPELRLASGAYPQHCESTGFQWMYRPPGVPKSARGFAWSPRMWNPKADTIHTYTGVILNRFLLLR